MARGVKKHLKTLNAPKHWMLAKIGGIYAPRPSGGPHKLRECVPLVILLRNRLKYALTRREVLMIVMQRLIKVDGKTKTDANYPAGFMDVVSIEKTGENFRMLYDTKGRFVLHKIPQEEVNIKLLRINNKAIGGRGAHGSNPYAPAGKNSVPYITSNDSRTIRYPDPEININDTVKYDFINNKIVEHHKFEVGNVAMIIRGNNVGRVGIIVSRERHQGSHDIIHLKDKVGNGITTRLSNVFVIGTGANPCITLPKGKGIKLTILEERDARLGVETPSA